MSELHEGYEVGWTSVSLPTLLESGRRADYDNSSSTSSRGDLCSSFEPRLFPPRKDRKRQMNIATLVSLALEGSFVATYRLGCRRVNFTACWHRRHLSPLERWTKYLHGPRAAVLRAQA